MVRIQTNLAEWLLGTHLQNMDLKQVIGFQNNFAEMYTLQR